MRALVPGKFSGASLSTPRGEVQLRLSEAGSWQLRVREDEHSDWRLLCTGNLDGGVFAAAPDRESRRLSIGPLTLDLAARSVAVNGADIALTSLEFELLARLASDPHRVFTKKELLREIWRYADGCRTRTLDSHASRLRVKLREAGADGLVLNRKAVGYQLCPAVEPPAALRPAA